MWFDENDELKSEFTVTGIYFELSKPSLIGYKNKFTDSLTVLNMYEKLDSLANILIKDGGIFEIQVHQDCRNKNQSSTNLTQRRAQALYEYLIYLGVNSTKLIPKGYGDTKPRVQNNFDKTQILNCDYIEKISQTEIEQAEFLHQLNRRVVIKKVEP